MIRQREADERHRIRLWGWKDDGKKVFNSVKEAFRSVENILKPHQNKHNYIMELEDIFKNVLKLKYNKYHKISYRILDYMISYDKKNKCIYRLIKNKYYIMLDIKQIYKYKHHLNLNDDSTFDPVEYRIDIYKFIHYLERSHFNSIRLTSSQLVNRRMLHFQYYKYKKYVSDIEQNIKQLDDMLVCKSVYHGRVGGCLKCNAVFIKGELMVKAINRQTKAEVLTTHKYEYDLLQNELIDMINMYKQCEMKYVKFNNVLYDISVLNIQHWIPFYILKNKSLKQYNKCNKSYYNYHIRRLSQMKHDIDTYFYNYYHSLQSTDMLYNLEYKYYDVARYVNM
jgi:hypothetical protein